MRRSWRWGDPSHWAGMPWCKGIVFLHLFVRKWVHETIALVMKSQSALRKFNAFIRLCLHLKQSILDCLQPATLLPFLSTHAYLWRTMFCQFLKEKNPDISLFSGIQYQHWTLLLSYENRKVSATSRGSARVLCSCSPSRAWNGAWLLPLGQARADAFLLL